MRQIQITKNMDGTLTIQFFQNHKEIDSKTIKLVDLDKQFFAVNFWLT